MLLLLAPIEKSSDAIKHSWGIRGMDYENTIVKPVVLREKIVNEMQAGFDDKITLVSQTSGLDVDVTHFNGLEFFKEMADGIKHAWDNTGDELQEKEISFMLQEKTVNPDYLDAEFDDKITIVSETSGLRMKDHVFQKVARGSHNQPQESRRSSLDLIDHLLRRISSQKNVNNHRDNKISFNFEGVPTRNENN